jgi:virulence factor Mce-like protein
MNTRIRRALVGAIVVGLVAAAGVGLRALLRAEPLRFSALFESTVGLYPDSDVQVLGVPVGRVAAVEPDGAHVRVTMEIDPAYDIAADTAAVIIAPTLVSDRFVQLTSPWVEGDDAAKLAAGAEIGPERTAVPVEIDDLYAGLRDMSEALGPNGANKNGALAELIGVGADNLEGQGEDMNTMFREFGKASATLSGLDENFFATLAHLDELNTMLLDNDAAVADVNRQFAEVADYLAEDRDDLGRAAKNLGAAMAVIDDFIRDNRKHLKKSVDNLVPTTKVLRERRKSLDEAVRLMPLLMHNFLDAYDAKNNVVVGRGNLNEVSLWMDDPLSARTSVDAPPNLLPGGSDVEGGQ